MPRYGNYTTIDVPTKKKVEALLFLAEQLDGFATVRTINNPHDFGTYPSFEIDIDRELLFHSEEDCDNSDCEKCYEYNKVVEKIDKVEVEYGDKFSDFL